MGIGTKIDTNFDIEFDTEFDIEKNINVEIEICKYRGRNSLTVSSCRYRNR